MVREDAEEMQRMRLTGYEAERMVPATRGP